MTKPATSYKQVTPTEPFTGEVLTVAPQTLIKIKRDQETLPGFLKWANSFKSRKSAQVNPATDTGFTGVQVGDIVTVNVTAGTMQCTNITRGGVNVPIATAPTSTTNVVPTLPEIQTSPSMQTSVVKRTQAETNQIDAALQQYFGAISTSPRTKTQPTTSTPLPSGLSKTYETLRQERLDDLNNPAKTQTGKQIADGFDELMQKDIVGLRDGIAQLAEILPHMTKRIDPTTNRDLAESAVRELFKPLVSYVTDKTEDLDERFDVLEEYFDCMGSMGEKTLGAFPQPLPQGVTQQQIDQNGEQLRIAFYEAIPANGLSDVLWALPHSQANAISTCLNDMEKHLRSHLTSLIPSPPSTPTAKDQQVLNSVETKYCQSQQYWLLTREFTAGGIDAFNWGKGDKNKKAAAETIAKWLMTWDKHDTDGNHNISKAMGRLEQDSTKIDLDGKKVGVLSDLDCVGQLRDKKFRQAVVARFGNPKIESLILSNQNWNINQVPNLSRLKNLKEVVLENNNLQFDDLATLATKLPSGCTVYLRGNNHNLNQTSLAKATTDLADKGITFTSKAYSQTNNQTASTSQSIASGGGNPLAIPGNHQRKGSSSWGI